MKVPFLDSDNNYYSAFLNKDGSLEKVGKVLYREKDWCWRPCFAFNKRVGYGDEKRVLKILKSVKNGKIKKIKELKKPKESQKSKKESKARSNIKNSSKKGLSKFFRKSKEKK